MSGRAWRLGLALACLGLGACRAGGATEDATDTGTATDSGESSADSGFPEPDACQGSEDCEGGHCVAAWTGEPPRAMAAL